MMKLNVVECLTQNYINMCSFILCRKVDITLNKSTNINSIYRLEKRQSFEESFRATIKLTFALTLPIFK